LSEIHWKEALDEPELVRVREALAERSGEAYWRELERLAGLPELRRFFVTRFPYLADRLTFERGRAGGTGLERRDFLRVMGASLAAAGLGACTRQPDERIVPWARSPEYRIPGKPLYFASAMPLDGTALGILVETHMGRPTKIEGNPDHPSSLGATDALAQAAIVSLYDPDRSRTPLRAGQIATFEQFEQEMRRRMDGFRATRGEGLHVLVPDLGSPTLRGQLAALEKSLPSLRVHVWRPVHRDLARLGARLAFGREVSVRWYLERARTVASLDADFLASGHGRVRHARDFAAARRVRGDTSAMNRLYAVESSASLTGAMADHRLAVKPSEVERVARALGRAIGLEIDAPPLAEREARFVRVLSEELRANAGHGLVLAGDWASPVVHAVAHAANQRLANVGLTVDYAEPLDPEPRLASESIRGLVDAIRSKQVDTLVVLGGNPVLDAPADFELATAFATVPFRVHLALHEDETSRLCHWHLPQAHFLETWSDARAHDGTATILQPMIAPLFQGRSTHELVALLAGEVGQSAHALVRRTWRARRNEDDAGFERFFARALHDGVVPDTRSPALDVPLARSPAFGPAPVAVGGLELALRPDPAVHDGRFANLGWLQEMPRPLTRLTWDNALLVSPATARAAGVENGDVLRVVSRDASLEAPVWITQGQPEQTLTLHLGYGRTAGGTLARGVGVDAYPLRAAAGPWSATGVSVERTGAARQLVSVQDHATMEGRDILRVEVFDRFRELARAPAGEGAGGHGAHDPGSLSLYPGYAYEENAWGMVIDLNACIGCNACMVACQAENNVPVVGKDQVALGREMHWIRIDRYYEESEEKEPLTLHQPVPCMHCENAPCELVCPVGATVHGAEGLNEMVYNRCVGTRYCSNNCPYKVRRFNFFRYADYETEIKKLGNNPDVTIRSRGVMEKCTYCIQRIRQTRIAAKKEDRAIGTDEIVTACQQACPTQAIVFGDINDEGSGVARLRTQPHHYGLLAETGTRPRTTYLAKLRNPNPELGAS